MPAKSPRFSNLVRIFFLFAAVGGRLLAAEDKPSGSHASLAVGSEPSGVAAVPAACSWRRRMARAWQG